MISPSEMNSNKNKTLQFCVIIKIQPPSSLFLGELNTFHLGFEKDHRSKEGFTQGCISYKTIQMLQYCGGISFMRAEKRCLE